MSTRVHQDRPGPVDISLSLVYSNYTSYTSRGRGNPVTQQGLKELEGGSTSMTWILSSKKQQSDLKII